MIKFYLPFSMGKRGPVNPQTYLQEIDHPVLDIGSSYTILKEEVRQWLNDTYGDDRAQWRFSMATGGYFIEFAQEEYVTAFKLRWL